MRSIQRSGPGALVCFILCAAAPAGARAADVFQIRDRQSDLTDPAYGGAFDAVYAQFNTLADSLETQINDVLSPEARTGLVSGFASANAGVTTALAGDHANSPSLFSVGLGLQGGVYVGGSGFSIAAANEIPEVGLGLQSAVTIGLKPALFGLSKLGPIDARRLSLYVSALSLSQSFQGFSAGMFNFGVKGQYQLVPPRGASFLLQWEGLNFGTGVLIASNEASYAANVSFEEAGATETVGVDLDYELGIRSTVTTIPLEFSTSVKLFSLITFFGGVGADLSFGGSTLTGGANGEISAVSTFPGLPGGGVNAFSGTADLDLEGADSSVAPPLLQSRAFVGAQFDLWLLKLGVEGIFNGTGAYGGAANVRLVF